MDCDVNIQTFANEAFVIERPADDCLLADHACQFLAKKGMKLLFGKAAVESSELDKLVTKSLPHSVRKISRTPATVPSGEGAILAAWSPVGKSLQGSTYQNFMSGFEMLGRAYCAGTPVTSVDFAVSKALEAGISREEINTFLDAKSVAVRYSDGGVAGLDAMSQEPDGKGAANDEAFAAFDEFVAAHGTPEFTQDDVMPSFQAKAFGSQALGPSYLDTEHFNFESLKEIQGLHPDLLKVVQRARQISEIAFEVVPDTGGMRDAAEQRRLQKAGKSKAKLGRHTIGHAIDLVPVDERGQPDFSDIKGFEKIRHAMELAANELGIPIQWGGNWRKLVDKPHYELDRKVYPGPDEEPAVHEILTAFR